MNNDIPIEKKMFYERQFSSLINESIDDVISKILAMELPVIIEEEIPDTSDQQKSPCPVDPDNANPQSISSIPEQPCCSQSVNPPLRISENHKKNEVLYTERDVDSDCEDESISDSSFDNSKKCEDDLVNEKKITHHQGEKPFHCEECHYKCSRLSHLKSHMRTHSDERPLICEDCGKVFKRSQDLKRHFRIHSEEKPFHCEECDYKCSQSSNLKRHLMTHSGEKPHQCGQCNYKCSQSSHLKKHLKTHSE